jgi:hypothetical protein
MLYSTIVRWELIRLGLGAIARVVAFDEEPTTALRSRNEHLRNGLGALLFFSGEVLQRNLVASLWQASRRQTRAEFRYGFSELRRAKPLSSGAGFARRHVPALLVMGSAAGLLVRARASAA